MSGADHWDAISAPRRMWGVFDVEQPYECTPRAIFSDEVEAIAWIAWCVTQNAADEDDPPYGNVAHYQALPMREVAGEVWNSYDPLQEQNSSRART